MADTPEGEAGQLGVTDDALAVVLAVGRPEQDDPDQQQFKDQRPDGEKEKAQEGGRVEMEEES